LQRQASGAGIIIIRGCQSKRVLGENKQNQNTMRTQTVLASIITCVVLALGTVAQAADSKVTGTWTWTQAGRGGRQGGQGGNNANANATPRKTTLKLKADGDKLTGTLTAPAFGGGRGGQGGGGAAAAAPTPTEISDGKITGDDISFSVKRDRNGNQFVTKYTGKVDGDKITGKIEMPGFNGGDPRTVDWNATREAAAAPAPEKK
jgi:hypothetical protein